ncbi:MAG: pyrroline-5-carboxylate reductase [bacterium]|nr:pyrroline-5-carboxylate reductase [bacterium]
MAHRHDRRIGFVGGGNMAEAFVHALLKAGCCLASDICVSDTRRDRVEHMRGTFGLRHAASNASCAEASDVIIIAVKPQNMAEALDDLAGGKTEGKLFLSIAAGFPTARIEEALGAGAGVIRAMPNTPALIGEGLTIWARGAHARDDDVNYARFLLGALGKELEVGEELMNAATALSGSGPAYVFYLLEAMTAAGAELGFTPEQALSIAVQTAIGASKLAEATGQSPEELRRRVTSPGGTTAAAIGVMEARGVRKAVIAAIRAACLRAAELAGK